MKIPFSSICFEQRGNFHLAWFGLSLANEYLRLFKYILFIFFIYASEHPFLFGLELTSELDETLKMVSDSTDSQILTFVVDTYKVSKNHK